MKRFVIREVETLKTTAALYDCDCCCAFDEWCDLGNGWEYCCQAENITVVAVDK